MAELLQVDCEMLGLSGDHYSITLRRYAGMALTNLTFGDVANKVGWRSLGIDGVEGTFCLVCGSFQPSPFVFIRPRCAP